MESIKIEVQLEKEDVQAATPIMFKDGQFAFEYWFSQALGVLVIPLLVLAFVIQNSVAFAMLLTYSVLMLALMCVNKISARKRLDRVWTNNKIWHSPMYYEISKSGVKVDGLDSKTEHGWGSYQKAMETHSLFLLRHPNFTYLMIPKRSLQSKDEIDHLRDFLKSEMGERFAADGR